MTGTEQYEAKIISKTQDFIDNSKYKKLLKNYFNFIQSSSLSSRYEYVVKVSNFLDYVKKDITEIGVDDIIDYLSYKEFKPDGSRYTSSYRISIYTALLHLFDYAHSADIITKNPMTGIKRPKKVETQKTIEKRAKGYLTKKEIKKVLQNVEEGVGSGKARTHQKKMKERDMLIFMIFLTTGIRCSALTKLDIDNLDLEGKILWVTDKGDKVKKIELCDDVITIAKKWLLIREQYCGQEEKGLFVSAIGKRMANAAVYKVIKKYTATISDKKITPHKLRATYGTQLYNMTHDIYFVQKCMGHSSPTTTELYIRESSRETKTASELLARSIRRN